MRKVIKDDAEFQVQQDETTGFEYHYRKDYMGTGDRKNDYSLALMWVKVKKREGEQPCTCGGK